MPFAKQSRSIARAAEYVGDGCFVQIQSFAAARDVPHAAARMPAPREHFSSRWRTHGANVKVFKTRSGPCELVDVRRCEIRVPVQTEITPSLIVCQNDEHVRWTGGDGDIHPERDHDRGEDAIGIAHGDRGFREN